MLERDSRRMYRTRIILRTCMKIGTRCPSEAPASGMVWSMGNETQGLKLKRKVGARCPDRTIPFAVTARARSAKVCRSPCLSAPLFITRTTPNLGCIKWAVSRKCGASGRRDLPGHVYRVKRACAEPEFRPLRRSSDPAPPTCRRPRGRDPRQCHCGLGMAILELESVALTPSS